MTSLGKALRLLNAFRNITPPVGVSELSRRVGLPKSTTFRLLRDLESAGFIERDGPNYSLGLSLFELGNRVTVCRPNGLRHTAMHHLGELHTQTGLATQLAVLDETDVIFVAEVGHQLVTRRHHMLPGTRRPASCSALGKAILAFSPKAAVQAVVENGLPRVTTYSIVQISPFLRELARIRERGIAYEYEESTLGIVRIAAPVIYRQQAVGAICVAAPAPVTTAPKLAACVREAAAAASRDYAQLREQMW